MLTRIRSDQEFRRTALERYERVADPPLLVLALAIVPLLVFPLIADLDPVVNDTLIALDWTIWAVFAGDLVVRTYLSEKRVRYLTTHWYDVIIVVIPFLRPLRVLRSVRLLRLGRLTRLLVFGMRALTTARSMSRRYGLSYVLAVMLFAIVTSATLVYVFERSAGGAIDDYGTAIWWAVVTVTTVGYGDAAPVTPEGRGVAIFLMIAGITFFGFLTASIAAFFVDEGRSNAETGSLLLKLESLEHEVRELRRELVENRLG